MTLRLLLVRHGLSSFNIEKRIQGRNDLSSLTQEGKSQAIKTGKVLSEIAIDHLYTSPLRRASETTENIIRSCNQDIKPIYDNGLLEVQLGEWSGLTIEEVKSKFPNDYEIWQKNPSDLEIKLNGEKYKPVQELFSQANNFINKLIKKHPPSSNKTILIVAHNAILRALILNLIGKNSQGFRRLRLNNASISIFNINKNQTNSIKVQIECLNSTTHLEPAIPKKGNRSRIILVRHGETDWNLQGRFQGQIDIPLNKNGKHQALETSIFLSFIKFSKAYTSSMTRPRETAEIILGSNSEVELSIEKDLIEINHGLWEGKLESEIRNEWSNLLSKWQNSPEKVDMPEGENIEQVAKRSINCWNKIGKSLSPNETALIVAHDAVNKTILCNLLGLKSSDIWMIKQGNGGVSVIEVASDSNEPSVISCLNLTSHLGSLLDTTATGAL